MNTIDIPATNAATNKGPAGNAGDVLSHGANFSASLHSAGSQADASSPASLTTQVTPDAANGTADAKGASAPTLFGRLHAANLLRPAMGDKPGPHTNHKGDDPDAQAAADMGIALPLQSLPHSVATDKTASAADAHNAQRAQAMSGRQTAARARASASGDTATRGDATNSPLSANAHTAATNTLSRHQLQLDQQKQQMAMASATTTAGQGTANANATLSAPAGRSTVPWAAIQEALRSPATGTSNQPQDGQSVTTLPGIGAIAGPQAGTATAKAGVLPMMAALQSPIGSAAWQQGLGQQLVHMTQRGAQQMELHVHPRELGPLQISLQIDHQGAQAHFLVAHAQVRDAVQQAIPQLREALAGQGIALGEAMVGQQQQQQQSQQQTGGFTGSNHRSALAVTERDIGATQAVHSRTVALPSVSGNGVDLYA